MWKPEKDFFFLFEKGVLNISEAIGIIMCVWIYICLCICVCSYLDVNIVPFQFQMRWVLWYCEMETQICHFRLYGWECQMHCPEPEISLPIRLSQKDSIHYSLNCLSSLLDRLMFLHCNCYGLPPGVPHLRVPLQVRSSLSTDMKQMLWSLHLAYHCKIFVCFNCFSFLTVLLWPVVCEAPSALYWGFFSLPLFLNLLTTACT